MDKQSRINKLEEIINSKNTKGSKKIKYRDEDRLRDAYQIPVKYLVFNQHNGRIGTYVKTYEKKHMSIKPEEPDGEEKLIEFLWNSDKDRNKKTLKSIDERGQIEPGIVTKDGVIIDGNRRCMIIKKLQEDKPHKAPTGFIAVILEDELTNNPKEIRKLETLYQMGVDEKVDYNPIEKYLKCKEMIEIDKYSPKDISEMIADTKEADVKKNLKILKLMEEYLENLGYGGMYTHLHKYTVEGPFVDLQRYLQQQEKKSTDILDLANLKQITFDYIRAGFRAAHGIRDIGNPSKGKSIFNNKKVWKSLLDKYKEEIDPVNDDEEELDIWEKKYSNEKLEIEEIIDAREEDWKNKVGRPEDSKSKLGTNLKHSKSRLDDENEADSPFILLEKAKNTLESINTDIDAFAGETIRNISHDIRKLAEQFIKIVDTRDKDK